VLDTDEDESAVVATTKNIPVTQSVVILTTSGGAPVSVVRVWADVSCVRQLGCDRLVVRCVLHAEQRWRRCYGMHY
jgi:hypothetical protein